MEIPKEGSDLVTYFLYAIISGLGTGILFFLKKTYEKVEGLDKRFNTHDVSQKELKTSFAEHQHLVAKSILDSKDEISKSFNEIHHKVDDLRLEVKSTGLVVQDNQKEMRELASKSLELFKAQDKRITVVEDSVQKIGRDLFIVKAKKTN